MVKPISEGQIACNSCPSLGELFLSFFRLGLTAFGGPAMMAHVNELAVKQKKWLDQETFKGGVVLAQSIPGATVMQAVAYVGLHTRGVPGALVAYVGFGLPAFLLMLCFSALYSESRSLPWVASIFTGLQVIVVAIVANATYTFARSSLSRYSHFVLAAASGLAFSVGISPFFVIPGAALIGILLVRNTADQKPAKSNAGHSFAVPVAALLSVLAVILLAAYLVRPNLLSLALLMLKVDLFAFGGGFASLPLMLQQVVTVRGWMDAKTFMDGIALGQVTPGPIVITATFVGYLAYGFPGALIATVSIFSPSFILLTLTAPFFNRLKASPLFSRATHGVLASFVGLLLYVTIKFGLAVPWDIVRIAMGLGALALLLRKIDLLYIVPVGAALSLLLF